MIYELEPQEFKKVLPLVLDLHYDLAARSVVSGITPGRIWVDDPENIKTSLLWEHSQNSEFHFLGKADNDRFNQSLEKLFKEEIYPEAAKKALKAYIVQYCTDDWKEAIPEMVSHPMNDFRRLYMFRSRDPIPDWKDKVPSGFRIVEVDEELLSSTDYENLSGITDQIGMVWRSTDEFLGYGFGFCAVADNEIASWCLAEYVSPGRSGLGVETIEKYRKKGLATAVSSACLEYCASNKLLTYWICWQDNTASVATAKKLRLPMDTEYPIYYGWFGEFDNALSNASLRFEQEDHRSASAWFEKAFKMAEKGKKSYLYHELKLANRYYYSAAIAAAVLEDKESAARYLHLAFEHGFTDLDKLKKEKRLKILHEDDVWKRIHGRKGMLND